MTDEPLEIGIQTSEGFAATCIRTMRGLELMAEEWDDLFDRNECPSPFLRATWVLAWLDAYLGDRPLACIAVRRSNRLIALAPLFVDNARGARILRLIGHGRMDYLGFLIARDEPGAWAVLGQALSALRGWDAIDLHWWNLEELPQSCLERIPGCTVGARIYESCPFLDTTKPFSEFLSQRRTKFRKWLKQVERQASSQGTPTIRILDEKSISTLDIAALADLETKSRHWAAKTAHFQDPRFASLLQAALQRGSSGLEICLAEISGSPVAAELLVHSNDVLYGIWTTYDATFKGCGNYVVSEAIRSAFDRGARRFDFMQGDETYKTWWATGTSKVHQLIVARGMRGRFWLVVVQLRWELARLQWARSLRQVLRHAASGLFVRKSS